MNRYSIRVLLFAIIVLGAVVALAQQQPAAVPRVIRFSGTLKNVDGSPRAGTFGITFSIYADEKTSVPLWQEVQNVEVDSTGRYAALLGSARSEGLPAELFADNNARWLGIRVESEQEQPRVLLAAVPYALKAADAETLGGKPLSAFVLNESSSAAGATATGAGATSAVSQTASSTIRPLINTSSTGTQNNIAKWIDSAGTLGDSMMIDTGTLVGVGKTPSLATLDVNGSVAAASSSNSLGVFYPLRATFTRPVATTGTGYGIGASFSETPAGGSSTVLGALVALREDSSFNWFSDLSFRVNATNSPAADETALTEIARITPNGMGIGKAPSLALLDVNGGIAAAAVSNTLGVFYAFRAAYTRPLATTGAGYGVGASFIETPTDGNPTALGAVVGLREDSTSTWFSDLSFRVNATNSPAADETALTEVARITRTGLGIGKTPSLATLDVNGGAAFSGNLAATGSITASSFSGSGASLTSLPAANLTGSIPSAALASTSLPAGNLTGTVPSNALGGTYSNPITLASASNSYFGNGSNLSNVAAASVGSVAASTANLRLITYLGGCDSCAVLTTSDNQKLIYQNLFGAPLTFLSITCYSDAGTPGINVQRDAGGTTTNLTASAISCTTSGNTVSSFTVTTMSANDKLNFLMSAPDGAARRVTVIIKATL